MLVRVYTCQNATLLEISCTGSNILVSYFPAKIHFSFSCFPFWAKWSDGEAQNSQAGYFCSDATSSENQCKICITVKPVLTLNAPITTKFVCFSRLLKC